MKKLTALAVSKITKPGRYAVGDGAYLQVTGENGRSWLFRYSDRRTGKAREMGLGPCDLVSLAEVRDKARACRKLLLDGIDPIENRQALRDRAKLDAARAITFKQAAEQYITAHEVAWRNAEHRRHWKATFEAFAYPVFGGVSVAAIDTPLVLKAIQPIWAAKTITAMRLRNRIALVLDWATANKMREGENPARWRGHLDKLLPKPSKVHRVRHLPALPYSEIPSLMAKVRADDSINARALEFIALTAVRLDVAARGRWDEIADGVWIISAERMKADREHRVPLSTAALQCLARLPRDGRKFLFETRPGKAFYGKILARETLPALRPGATVHGLRSTFRDWAAERTAYPREVAEAALAHAVKNKVEAAYLRTDFFDRRRALMEDWARFCGGAPA